MRVLIVGDSHISDKTIPELTEVFKEILSIPADRCVHLGDYYDSHRLSPQEIAFGTQIAKDFVNKYKIFTLLSGNGRHEWLGQHNIISYLKHVGVHVQGMKWEEEIDHKKFFFGHFMTNQSMLEYGSADINLSDLAPYRFAFLGHQHIFQELLPNKVYHLGSAIFQHYNETKDEFKRVAIVEDGKLEFIRLKTPIPMVDLGSIRDVAKFSPNTKVRIIYKSFADWKKEVNLLSEFGKKFYDFKIKLDFAQTQEDKTIGETKILTQKLEEIIFQEIERVEDGDVRALLRAQYEEEANNGNV